MRQKLLNAGLQQPAPECQYCNNKSLQVTGVEVYPNRKDLHKKIFYICYPCDARVGCHPGTNTPLGQLANGDLRKWRTSAHNRFDTLWKKPNGMKRGEAYSWLQSKMGMSKKECHIGKMTIQDCKLVIKFCRQ